MLLEPLTLVGTIIGVRLNKMLPFAVLAMMMTLLMLLISFKTLHRALGLYRVECRVEKHIEIQSGPQESINVPLLADQETEEAPTLVSDNAEEARRMQLIELVAKREATQYPLSQIGGLVLCWFLALVPSFIVSEHSGLAIECLSTSYFVVLSSFVLLLCGMAALNAASQIRFQRVKRSTGVVPEEDLHWSTRKVFTLASVSMFAGILSAMVGVGGSTIKGPFLVHFFSNPNVAASTSGFMLLSTCSSSMLQFVFLNMLNPGMAVLFFAAGFLAASIGARIWIALIKKYNRRSYIVFLLSGYVFIAAIFVGVISIAEYSSGTLPKIDSAC
jgi:uncharacterized membrane protein YfcA